MKSKVITHKGVDITMSVDVDSFMNKIIVPYKDKIDILEDKVKQRDKYIKNIHKQLRSKSNIIFGLYSSYSIYKLTNKGLSLKRLLILSYLYDIEFATQIMITKYINKIGIKSICGEVDMLFLKKNNLITNAGGSKFVYITDYGRQKVENAASYMTSAMTFFINNKKITNTVNVDKNGVKQKRDRFTEEAKLARSVWYKKMMKPFWDSNIKKIPKDKIIRIEILSSWIEEEKKNGNEVDEMYITYLQKWSH